MMKIKWNVDLISKEAKKYKRRKYFEKGFHNSYVAAPPLRPITLEGIKITAAKYSTRGEFRSGSRRHYKKASELKILDKV